MHSSLKTTVSESVQRYMFKCHMIRPSERQWRRWICCQGHSTDKFNRTLPQDSNMIECCLRKARRWKSLRPYFYLRDLSHSGAFYKAPCLTYIKSNETQQCDLMQIVSWIKQREGEGLQQGLQHCRRWLTASQTWKCLMKKRKKQCRHVLFFFSFCKAEADSKTCNIPILVRGILACWCQNVHLNRVVL